LRSRHWAWSQYEILAVLEQVERSVERVVNEVADNNPGDLDLQTVEDTDDEVMGKRPGCFDVAHRQAIGVPFRAPIHIGRIFSRSSLRTTM